MYFHNLLQYMVAWKESVNVGKHSMELIYQRTCSVSLSTLDKRQIDSVISERKQSFYQIIWIKVNLFVFCAIQ